jgi:hypothetical protein
MEEAVTRLCPTCLHDGVLERTLERARTAEAKLAAIRELCEDAGTRTGGHVLAIIGAADDT